MTDAEMIAELRALLAERDAECRRLERTMMDWEAAYETLLKKSFGAVWGGSGQHVRVVHDQR